jgi:hypothetical protein
VPPVTDLRDTRVLIPRVRRALQGPQASGLTAEANELSDDEANGLIADALADIILYGGGEEVFGHQLVVSARDEDYMAPIAWMTDTPLTEYEGSVVIAQAALNYYLNFAKTLKTSERIADEGQEWEYQIAATVITQQIKALREDRDRALEALRGRNVVTDDYINYLQVRDSYTDSLIEPWAFGGGRGGQEFCP